MAEKATDQAQSKSERGNQDGFQVPSVQAERWQQAVRKVSAASAAYVGQAKALAAAAGGVFITNEEYRIFMRDRVKKDELEVQNKKLMSHLADLKMDELCS